MPRAHTWELKYLRTKCGLPPLAPTLSLVTPVVDPDDPATTLLTTEQAATAAHVPPSTVRSWDHRGLIAPAGSVEGAPLYRELDVLAAELATRRAPRTRRLHAEAAQGLATPA